MFPRQSGFFFLHLENTFTLTEMLNKFQVSQNVKIDIIIMITYQAFESLLTACNEVQVISYDRFGGYWFTLLSFTDLLQAAHTQTQQQSPESYLLSLIKM